MKLHDAPSWAMASIRQHTVGLRELKNRLSEYVRLVRAGEHVQVTDRGQVVAELLPPAAAADRQRIAGEIRERRARLVGIAGGAAQDDALVA